MGTDEQDLKRYTDALRDERDHMDAATRSKLNQARQRALAEMDKPSVGRSWIGRHVWVPATATAMLVLFVAGLAPALFENGAPQNGPAVARTPQVPDLDMVLAGESLDMIEDVDFYLWLQEEQSSSDAGINRNAGSRYVS